MFPAYKGRTIDMGVFKLKIRSGLILALFAFGTPILAQNSLLSREVASRSAGARDAYTLLEEGDVAYLKQDFKTAVGKYAEALSKLPEGAQAVSGLRASAVQRFSQASLVRAQDLVRKGDAAGARPLMDAVEVVNPDSAELALLRKKIDDPIRNNPSLTREHTANVDKVRRLLYEAEGYYDLAKFDHAMLAYEDVLRIDKYNKAARRGMERVDAAKSGYLEAARDQARAELLKDVAAGWEQTVPPQNTPLVAEGNDFGLELSGAASIETKLNTIILPEVNLNGASLAEAIDFLRVVSVQEDTSTLEEAEKGVTFVVQLGDESNDAVKKVRASLIDLKLRNVPLVEAIRLVSEATSTSYRIDDFAVVLNTAGFSDPALIRRSFKVPPSFLRGAATTGLNDSDDPFAAAVDGEGGLIAKSLTAVEKLKSFDVSFPEGATASYSAATNVLTVRNTTANMRLIEAIVAEVAKTEPVIVSVKAKIFDISQENLEELGFDTVLGQFNVGAQGILSGGTTGTGIPITDTIAGNPVSSGLGSGVLTNTSDGLDALLEREAPSSASGTFGTTATGGAAANFQIPSASPTGIVRTGGFISLRGIIDGTAHEILARGLSQKTGTDVLIHPEVLTLPGQNAVVQSVMEFPYPDEYEPPELPNAVGTGITPVTPATPSSFLTENLGVSLEVLPQVGPDRRIIEVAVNPVIKDFEGFINYGTPVVGFNTNTTLNLATLTATTSGAFGEITPNAILKPLFRTIRGKTSLRILDGQTIVMGGLLSETRRIVNDKVPILGDLPFVGRIFRNDGVSVEKRSILIFITVELVDPAGNPYRDR